jgi:FdhD protein
MDAFSEVPIIRVRNNKQEEMLDHIATEIACTLIVNDKVLVSLLCSPIELENMAIGFLVSEGFVKDVNSIKSIDVDQKNFTVKVSLPNLTDKEHNFFNKKTITSGCGQGITFSDPDSLRDISDTGQKERVKISSANVIALLQDFRNISDLYLKTGGVHSAALAIADKILLFSEDIGRHNAVDKLIGKAFLSNMRVHDKILISSGRISGEIMTKVIRNRIPIMITRTAPTCMSINYAQDYGVTLIGFARGNRMNVYTHPLRLK